MTEYEEANTIADEVDALIDLMYFAAGRMQEMGVDGARAFASVHACNMQKVRGELSKRPGSCGHDAVKPPGWKAPDYRWLTLKSIKNGSRVKRGGHVYTVVDMYKSADVQMLALERKGESYLHVTAEEVEAL